MSIQIRSLSSYDPAMMAPPRAPEDAPNDWFNILREKDTLYDLYIAPSTRSAIVKSIRLANKHATLTAKVTLFFNHPNANGKNRSRRLTPPSMELPPGFTYIDDGEITLDPSDTIQAIADTADAIQYVISGVEREVT